jgi:hypothetical protein
MYSHATRGQNLGPPGNDTPLNLNFPKNVGGYQPPGTQSAQSARPMTNSRNQGQVNRGRPDTFSPRSGAQPMTSDDDMSNLDEGYQGPSVYVPPAERAAYNQANQSK